MSHQENYEDYLKSDHWYFMIILKRLQVDNKCEICGSSHGLEVHHLTYERLGNENLEDLQVLCSYHHKKVHGIESLVKQLMKRKRDILKNLIVFCYPPDKLMGNPPNKAINPTPESGPLEQSSKSK
jgi:hypothetical protein